MASGFLNAGAELDRAEGVCALGEGDAVERRWDFLDLVPWLQIAPSGKYLRALKASRSRFFKPFRLMKIRATCLALLVYGPLLALFSLALWLSRHWLARGWDAFWEWVRSLASIAPVRWFLDLAWVESVLAWYRPRLPAWIWIPSAFAGALLMYLVVRYLPAKLRAGGFAGLRRAMPFLNRLTAIVRAAVAVVAWIFVWASLFVLDRLFLWHGQASKLPPPSKGPND